VPRNPTGTSAAVFCTSSRAPKSVVGLIETTIRSEEVPIIVGPPNPYQVHALRAHALSLSQGGGPWTISDVHHVQLNGSGQEVVAVCEQYVDHLTKLVQDFIHEHPE
jgi:hypothetical protein